MKKVLEIPSLKTSETIRFISELNELTLSSEDELHLYMRSTWVEPLGMLLCSSAIKQYAQKNRDKRIYLSRIDDDAIKYAAYMGFFKAISNSIEIGNAPGVIKSTSNYVPISPINFDELHSFEIENGNYIDMGDTIEKKSQELAKVICRSEKNLQHLFSYIIREILRNTPEHADTNEATICGQYWSNGRASIAIVDEGIGIKRSLEKNNVHKEYVLSDEDALQVCVKPGISQSFSPE